jgi:ribosome maturation protein Sdo1
MTKSYYTITVCGKRHEWVFPILVDPKYIKDWREDGLVIDEVVAIRPETVWYMKYWLRLLHELDI